MKELTQSPFFGITLTVVTYWLGMKIQKKVNFVLCNGLIIAVLVLVGVLVVLDIPYEDYYQGGTVINMFMGPATACMAVTIYAKIDLPLPPPCPRVTAASYPSLWRR